jgi:hypothetical protein
MSDSPRAVNPIGGGCGWSVLGVRNGYSAMRALSVLWSYAAERDPTLPA